MFYWALLIVTTLWVVLDFIAIVVRWQSIDLFFRVFESRFMAFAFSVLNFLLVAVVLASWTHLIITKLR